MRHRISVMCTACGVDMKSFNAKTVRPMAGAMTIGRILLDRKPPQRVPRNSERGCNFNRLLVCQRRKITEQTGRRNQGAHRYHSIFRLLDTQRRNLVRRNRRAHRSVERLPLDRSADFGADSQRGDDTLEFRPSGNRQAIPESRILRSRRREANPVLGNQVKRLAVSLGGLLFGLLVTWAFSTHSAVSLAWRIRARRDRLQRIGKVSYSVVSVPLVIGYLCGPAIAFCLLNAVAWRRWSARKWVGEERSLSSSRQFCTSPTA